MRNNNPNIFHRFYELIDFSYVGKADDEKYKLHFPVLTYYEKDSIQRFISSDVSTISSGKLVVWPQSQASIFPEDKESKLYNIWMALLNAVPLHQQKEVVDFYDEFINKRNELGDWLLELLKRSLSVEGYSKRTKDILLKSRQFAQDKINRKQNYDAKTKEMKSLDQITEEIIRNFLSKEYGTSLYKLINEMKDFRNPPIIPISQ